MKVSRSQLKSELSQRFKVASVAEITEVRRKLNHEKPDSVEMSEVESNTVQQWFEEHGDRLENANTNNKKKSRKTRTDNEANKDAIVTSAKSRHSALLTAGAKTGCSEADDFQQSRQAAFVKRLEQHNKRDANLIEQQLMNLCGHISQTTEVNDIENLPETEKNYLKGEEMEMSLPPAAGIGFNF